MSPKPGHIERVKTPLGNKNSAMDEDEPAYRERFLKINVRHVTDGQVNYQYYLHLTIILLIIIDFK